MMTHPFNLSGKADTLLFNPGLLPDCLSHTSSLSNFGCSSTFCISLLMSLYLFPCTWLEVLVTLFPEYMGRSWTRSGPARREGRERGEHVSDLGTWPAQSIRL